MRQAGSPRPATIGNWLVRGDLESPTTLPCEAVAQWRSSRALEHPRRAIFHRAPPRTLADRLASGERSRGQWTVVFRPRPKSAASSDCSGADAIRAKHEFLPPPTTPSV